MNIMRPKHNRHPYKGTKFRKITYDCNRSGPNFNLYANWLDEYFLPKYVIGENWPYRPGMMPNLDGGRAYRICRKLYNAHYKALRREHKKNGGFCIGDQFWNIIK